MGIKGRKTLYYFFALIFVVWGAYLITSTQGLVFDPKKLQFVKTGGIYLKFIPTDASVFLNGEPVNKSPGLLNRGILINDLLPRIYHIKIQREGTTHWEKDLDVVSGMITPASAIRLWYTSSTYERVATSTNPYFFTAHGVTLTKNKNGNLIALGKELRGSDFFAGRSDSRWIIIHTKNNQLFFVDINAPESAINLQEIFNSLKTRQLEIPGNVPIKNALIHPFSDEKVIIATEQSLYSIDLKRITIERLTTSTSTIDFLIEEGGSVFGIGKNGTIQGANLVLKSEFNFSIAATSTVIAEVSVDTSGSRIAFKDAQQSLFFHNRSGGASVKLADNVRVFSLSPDGKKIIWINNNKKVFVYYAEKDDGDLKFKKGSIVELSVPPTILRQNSTAFWLPEFSSYIFIKTEGTLTAVEIDPRGETNTATLIDESYDFFVDDAMRLNVIKKEGTFFSLFVVTLE